MKTKSTQKTKMKPKAAKKAQPAIAEQAVEPVLPAEETANEPICPRHNVALEAVARDGFFVHFACPQSSCPMKVKRPEPRLRQKLERANAANVYQARP